MLEWLDVQPGEKVLDLGSGSGWTTALLSNITGPEGSVFAVEIIPELVKLG
jgi:protein-L-isoaspartate(D-aspartate) O-methyltransferase